MVDFTLPVQYLRQIAEQLRAMGVAPEDWLARSQLSPRRLDEPGFQPDFAVFRQLIEDALTLTGEPAFGLLIGAFKHGALWEAVLGGVTRDVLAAAQLPVFMMS